MRITDILHEKGSDVVTIHADGTIHEAVRRLNEHEIGALVVTGESESEALVGIITERDILRLCGSHCVRPDKSLSQAENSCSLLVRHAMTSDVVIGVPDDDLNYVMGVMRTLKKRCSRTGP